MDRVEATKCRKGHFSLSKRESPKMLFVSKATVREDQMAIFGGNETHARSVLKAASWRVVDTIDNFLTSWLFTGKLELVGSGAECHGLRRCPQTKVCVPLRLEQLQNMIEVRPRLHQDTRV